MPPVPVPAGPSLIAQSSAGRSSGPPGAGIELRGSGYPDCPTVYFFLDGARIGSGHPDATGTVRSDHLAIPGDAKPGQHVMETSCHASGSPVRATTTFEVVDTDLHRTVVMTALPKPGDVDLGPKSVGASLAGTIVMMLLIAFPGGLLDSTLDAHYGEVRGWFGLRPKPEEAVVERSLLVRSIQFVAFLLVGGLAGSLLDPNFGLSRSTLALALGLSVSLGVVCLGFSLPGITYRRRRHREWGRVLLRPGALALTAALVVASRLLHLQPGYLFGLIGGLVFGTELSRKADGRLATLTSMFILLVSLSAWLVWAPVSAAASKPGAGFWLVVAEAALGGTFIAGIESLVVGLLPLRDMEGGTIRSWNALEWITVYGLGMFAYVLIVLRPASSSGPSPQGQTWKAMAIAGVFAAFAIGFWAYFRLRPARDPSPGDENESRSAVAPIGA